MTDTLTGGCLCGRHRYEITGKPVVATHCLCSSCRRASGGTLGTWLTAHSSDFRWTTAEPAYYASTPGTRRGFCATCGTSLSFQRDDRNVEVDVGAATLDNPERITPVDHIWASDRLSWSPLAPGLPLLDKSHWHHGYPDGED